MKKSVCALSFILVTVISCTYDKGKILKPKSVLTNCDFVSYTNDVAPLLSTYCTSCHNSSFANYDLTTYSGVKQKVDNGSLRYRVFELKDMPGYCELTESELSIINCWVQKGAPDN